MLHYTHCEKVVATIDVQTESGSSQTTADLARRGLRTTAGKNWSANRLPTVQKIISLCRTKDSLTGRGGGKDLFNGSKVLVTSPSEIA